MSDSKTISFHRLVGLLSGAVGKDRFDIKDNPSFGYRSDPDLKYVEPVLSRQPTSVADVPVDGARIILVSAPGATGKTAMTTSISQQASTPVFDLGKHEAVGSYSFVGMLFQTLPPDQLPAFLSGLQSGGVSVLIDALDEGCVKTGQAAFESFLGDIATMASTSKGCPFVIFGRTSVLELATVFFEERGVPVALLQIEPFIIDKAKEFVDNAMPANAISSRRAEYTRVRDYIIESVEGFFKSESDMRSNLFRRFIGYAPVLQSIGMMLRENLNFFDLYKELKQDNKKNVELVADIIERILLREVGKVSYDDILERRSTDFCDMVQAKAFSPDEQCERLLCRMLDRECDFRLTDDDEFNRLYDAKIEDWLKDHPFLDHSGRVVNVVFESYLLVRFMCESKYADAIYGYLHRHFGGMYMLFDFYVCSYGRDAEVDPRFLRFLYDSYQSRDRTDNRVMLEIEALSDDDTIEAEGVVRCSAEFKHPGSGGQETETDAELSLVIPVMKALELGSAVRNMIIDAPVDVVMPEVRAEFTSNVEFRVDSLMLQASYIVFNGSADGKDKDIIIECDTFCSSTSDGSLPVVSNMGGADVQFVNNSDMYFPLVQYKVGGAAARFDDKDLMDYYQKLRRIILHFRSHSKGVLAKYKRKIDSRIGDKSTGRVVLDALIAKGVIYSDETMYYISPEKLASELGVNFSGIRSFDVNDTVKAFLQSLVKK